jgi:hypothetical protein
MILAAVSPTATPWSSASASVRAAWNLAGQGVAEADHHPSTIASGVS